ncbi:hypothetical protein EGW08_017148, partial [Elysia chlorotica]
KLKRKLFQSDDYAVAVIIMLLPVGVGILHALCSVKNETRDEYMFGGHNMPIVLVTLSTFMKFVVSNLMIDLLIIIIFSIIIIAMPACRYSLSHNLHEELSVLSNPPCLFGLPAAGVIHPPSCLYKSVALRLFMTALSMIRNVGVQALILVLPALALKACIDMSIRVSLVLLGAVTIVYTALGGIKSVIIVDAFQTTIVLIGTFAYMIQAIIKVGSFHDVWRISGEGGRLNLHKVTLDPRTRHTHWSLVIGYTFLWSINSYGQASLQRINSIETERGNKISYLMSVPLILIFGLMNCVLGLCIYAYYTVKGCGPYQAGIINNKNQIAPYFVHTALDDVSGAGGMYFGILCSASLSALASGINAMAANTVQDFLSRPLEHVKEKTIVMITKAFVLVYGALSVGTAYFISSWIEHPATEIVNAFFGIFGSPVLGVVVLGASVPWANKYGAFAGALITLGINLCMGLGHYSEQNFPEMLPPISTKNCCSGNFNDYEKTEAFNICYNNGSKEGLMSTTFNNSVTSSYDIQDKSKEAYFIFQISYEWYSVIGCCLCIVISTIVSFFTKAKPDENGRFSAYSNSTDAQYIYPFLRRYWGLED